MSTIDPRSTIDPSRKARASVSASPPSKASKYKRRRQTPHTTMSAHLKIIYYYRQNNSNDVQTTAQLIQIPREERSIVLTAPAHWKCGRREIKILELPFWIWVVEESLATYRDTLSAKASRKDPSFALKAKTKNQIITSSEQLCASLSVVSRAEIKYFYRYNPALKVLQLSMERESGTSCDIE